MAKAHRFIDGHVVEVEVEGCASCGTPTGTFRIIDGKRYCKNNICGPADKVRDTAKSTFPFTTTHFDGNATEVKSMRHLRQLENQHGVHCCAYNQNQNNFDRG